MPLATMPWWKSLTVMNENKGVFGLNMLKWWDREGNLDRVTEPLMSDLEAGRLEPVVAESFPFERAGDAHVLSANAATSARSCCFPSGGRAQPSRGRHLHEEGIRHLVRDCGDIVVVGVRGHRRNATLSCWPAGRHRTRSTSGSRPTAAAT